MTYPSLTLYYSNGACSLAAHTLLLRHDIPFTPVLMKAGPVATSSGMGLVAADGSLSHEDYLAINPTGYVPALAVGQGEGAPAAAVTEMPAVLAYIASLVPHAKLLGDGPLQQAQAISKMSWLASGLHASGFGIYFLQGRVTDDESAFPGVKRKTAAVIEKGFARIERDLTGRDFTVGDGLTAVDYYLYPFWRWAKTHGFDLGRYPRYAAHMKMVEGLEETKKVLAAEGLTQCFE